MKCTAVTWSSPIRTSCFLPTTPRIQPGPLAWTTKYGDCRVAYLLLGHDHQAWQNPNYPKLLLQAIEWAAGR